MPEHEPDKPGTSAREREQQDARELRRGVAINLLGYLIKAAHPVLLVAAVRLYGAETFGVFTLVQATAMLAMRAVIVGLDKAVLWWVPRQPADQERRGLLPVLLLCTGLSALATLVIGAFGHGLMSRWNGEAAADALRIMVVSLLPMTLMEVLLHAILGKRLMGARVVVRETIVPLTQVGLGVLLYHLGFVSSGLAIAYVASYVFGLTATVYFFRRAFRASRFPRQAWPLPPEMLKYSLPMWLSEMVNSFAMRLDVYLIAALTDATTVGIYAAVTQVGNTLRSIRQSFDSLVVAQASQISSRREPKRLQRAFSRATVMVMVTQMPVYAFLFAFAVWLMPLFGPGFERGTDGVLVLAGSLVLISPISLSGLILYGFGRTDLVLVSVLVGAVTLTGLLWWLVPLYDVTGAALAVGLNLTGQNVYSWFVARRVARAPLHNHWVGMAVLGGLAAAAAMATAWWLLAGTGEPAQRVGAFVAFLVVGGLALWRSRVLIGPAET